jgi:SSS family solute:Na+ symporter
VARRPCSTRWRAASFPRSASRSSRRRGPGSPFDASFWTAPVVAFAVYIGLQWWAYEAVDGGGYVVQRISACKDERHGVLAQIWFQVAHNALRPWCWIVVALASLLVMPTAEHRTPVAGTIARAELGRIEVAPTSGAPNAVVAWDAQAPNPPLLAVKLGDAVGAGQIVARTDSERAYPEMMARYLPVGLLGLVVASLLAALMSTIDTHVNLASSFFVNDVYRRFLAKDRSDRHYVTAARLSGLGVMALAGIVASQADSIRGLFTFFLAFMGGVGAVYVLRWTWWRVRATTEIAAMLTSSLTTVVLTHADIEWRLGPFADHGALTDEGRLVLVVLASTIAAVLVTIFGKAPDPAKLVAFYRKVRPLGFLGPSRRARARRRAAARGALRATRRGRRTRGDVRARVHDRRSLVRQRGGNLDQRDRRDHGHRRGGHRSARDHSRRGTRMTRGQ